MIYMNGLALLYLGRMSSGMGAPFDGAPGHQ